MVDQLFREVDQLVFIMLGCAPAAVFHPQSHPLSCPPPPRLQCPPISLPTSHRPLLCLSPTRADQGEGVMW